MLIILFSAMALAVAEQTNTHIPGSASSHRNSQLYPTLVSNILQLTGYRESCVAEALDTCSTVSEQNQPSSLIQVAREVVRNVSLLVNKTESRPRHCKDLLDSGDSGSGLRLVYPYPGQPHHRVTVYCDHTVHGGGWTVIQKRSNHSIRQDFYRTWQEYKLGFGQLEGEYWLGLDLLHVLTSTALQQLGIQMSDYEGEERWAQYDFFHVDSAETKYRLSVGRYSGDAGDGLSYNHGQRFSTHDQDNDAYSGNCAELYRGAWWYKACSYSSLNGYQHQGTYTASHPEGIYWSAWRGRRYSLRQTSMMIRPAF